MIAIGGFHFKLGNLCQQIGVSGSQDVIDLFRFHLEYISSKQG